MSDVLILLTTFPDLDTARSVVRALVMESLAACGNIIPGVESIYRWQGKVETSAEVIVIFKTTAASAEAAQATVCFKIGS